MKEKLLCCSNINKSFKKSKKRSSHIIKDLSLEIYEEETLGLVGESGSGKSTLSKILIQLIEADSGKIIYRGRDITNISNREKKKLKKEIQYIFQDPKSALNRSKKVGWLLEEPLKVHTKLTREERREKILELLDLVGLSEDYLEEYPRRLSGGQAQRIAILCSLMNSPRLIIADEPVSALDVSIQAQILNFLQFLKSELKLTMVFITHDLSVCYYMADRVAVMYAGRVVEIGQVEAIYKEPKHPYTKELLNSSFKREIDYEISSMDRGGEIQLGKNFCEYIARCPYRMEKCRLNTPEEYKLENQTRVRCFLYEEKPNKKYID